MFITNCGHNLDIDIQSSDDLQYEAQKAADDLKYQAQKAADQAEDWYNENGRPAIENALKNVPSADEIKDKAQRAANDASEWFEKNVRPAVQDKIGNLPSADEIKSQAEKAANQATSWFGKLKDSVTDLTKQAPVYWTQWRNRNLAANNF